MMVQDLCDWAGVTFGDVFQFSEEDCDWVKLGYKYLGPAVSFLQTAGKRNVQFEACFDFSVHDYETPWLTSPRLDFAR